MVCSRIYLITSDGYCQQGGVKTGSVNIGQGQEGGLGNVIFLKPFRDVCYYANASCDETYCLPFRVARDPGSCFFSFGSYEQARTLSKYTWTCSGYLA